MTEEQKKIVEQANKLYEEKRYEEAAKILADAKLDFYKQALCLKLAGDSKKEQLEFEYSKKLYRQAIEKLNEWIGKSKSDSNEFETIGLGLVAERQKTSSSSSTNKTESKYDNDQFDTKTTEAFDLLSACHKALSSLFANETEKEWYDFAARWNSNTGKANLRKYPANLDAKELAEFIQRIDDLIGYCNNPWNDAAALAMDVNIFLGLLQQRCYGDQNKYFLQAYEQRMTQLQELPSNLRKLKSQIIRNPLLAISLTQMLSKNAQKLAELQPVADALTKQSKTRHAGIDLMDDSERQQPEEGDQKSAKSASRKRKDPPEDASQATNFERVVRPRTISFNRTENTENKSVAVVVGHGMDADDVEMESVESQTLIVLESKRVTQTTNWRDRAIYFIHKGQDFRKQRHPDWEQVLKSYETAITILLESKILDNKDLISPEDLRLYATWCKEAGLAATEIEPLNTTPALKFYNIALSIFKSERLLTAQDWHSRAICYMNIGDLDQALKSYENAIETFEKHGLMTSKDFQDYVDCFSGIGDVYLGQYKLDDSIKFYRKAIINMLKMNKLDETTFSKSDFYSKLSILYKKMSSATSSLKAKKWYSDAAGYCLNQPLDPIKFLLLVDDIIGYCSNPLNYATVFADDVKNFLILFGHKYCEGKHQLFLAEYEKRIKQLIELQIFFDKLSLNYFHQDGPSLLGSLSLEINLQGEKIEQLTAELTAFNLIRAKETKADEKSASNPTQFQSAQDKTPLLKSSTSETSMEDIDQSDTTELKSDTKMEDAAPVIELPKELEKRIDQVIKLVNENKFPEARSFFWSIENELLALGPPSEINDLYKYARCFYHAAYAYKELNAPLEQIIKLYEFAANYFNDDRFPPGDWPDYAEQRSCLKRLYEAYGKHLKETNNWEIAFRASKLFVDAANIFSTRNDEFKQKMNLKHAAYFQTQQAKFDDAKKLYRQTMHLDPFNFREMLIASFEGSCKGLSESSAIFEEQKWYKIHSESKRCCGETTAESLLETYNMLKYCSNPWNSAFAFIADVRFFLEFRQQIHPQEISTVLDNKIEVLRTIENSYIEPFKQIENSYRQLSLFANDSSLFVSLMRKFTEQEKIINTLVAQLNQFKLRQGAEQSTSQLKFTKDWWSMSQASSQNNSQPLRVSNHDDSAVAMDDDPGEPQLTPPPPPPPLLDTDVVMQDPTRSTAVPFSFGQH